MPVSNAIYNRVRDPCIVMGLAYSVKAVSALDESQNDDTGAEQGELLRYGA
jgi:hypothetical protein